MRARRLALPLLALPLALAGLLAGCTHEPVTAPTPQAQAEDTPRPTKAPARAPQDGADDGDAGGRGDVAPAGDLAQCLIGEWVADQAAAIAASNALMAAAGLQATTTVRGESVTTFGPDTVTATYADYVTEVTVSAEGQTVTTVTRMNGTMTQSYTLDGDVLTSVAAQDLSGVQIESTVLIDGEELFGYSDGFQEGLDSASTAGESSRQRVTCSGDTLTTQTLDLGSLGMGDITLTLTRR